MTQQAMRLQQENERRCGPAGSWRRRLPVSIKYMEKIMTDRWFSNTTQIYWASRALVQGQTLNHMDVIRGVKGWRLSAIVETLRNTYGWPIVTEFRGKERIGHYHLHTSCDPKTLTFPPSAKCLVTELQDSAKASLGGVVSDG